MLSPKAQLSLRNAREYFREHLSTGDYYAEGQHVTGAWFGFGAEKLGLQGPVTEKEFLRLCEGLHPQTGERLTQRLNSSRQSDTGKTVANRRVFYDFTFSPPKSVSVVALLQADRISPLHEHAVRQALLELEKFAATRVRKAGQRTDRVTGNVVTATFRHETSRALDPHLHTHGIVFNATLDPVENRWKALEASGLYRAQKLIEGCYYHELARGLRRLGYKIEPSPTGFEINGVPRSVLARFSKRHRAIAAEAERRMAEGKTRGNAQDVREQVARDARQRKIKNAMADRLRPAWERELTTEERVALHALRTVRPQLIEPAHAAEMIAWAEEHLFERRSVVSECELLATALTHGRGREFEVAGLREAVAQRGYLRDDDTGRLTSRDVLRCELDIVVACRAGRLRYPSLNAAYAPSPALSAEQSAAVRQILGSRDFITLFRGGAGTGKSHTLKEVERGLAAADHPVVVLAPQRQQVGDLTRDGLPAQTVSRLLLTRDLSPGAVVIVDEAGQLGGRQLRALARLVQAQSGRLILSGDTRQHGAVTASDALRAIEAYGQIESAEIHTIRRQDPARGRSVAEQRFIRRYRAAVKAAAAGEIAASFDQLDRMGCVRELAEDTRREALAAEYLAAVARKESTLVVAQTWAEVHRINDAIRAQLRAAGKLGAGRTLIVYQAVDATTAQKRDPPFYPPGHYVYFLQRYGRYAKGDVCEVAGANPRGLVLIKGGRRATVSYRYADRWSVVAPKPLELAPGDRLQLKFNGQSVEGAALTNGELVTVRRVRRDGAIVIVDEDGRRKTLAASQRLFVRGYAVTSYASQGKTVDTVLLADAANPAATNRNQWYVAISRGRKKALVFTDDKAALRADIVRSGERTLALELRASAPLLVETRQSERTPRWWTRAWASIERARRFQSLQAFRTRPRQISRNQIRP